MFKKAAMFGLDARIALSIFASLSVISGAALYNAIQQAQVIAIITDLKEVHKAFDQYELDTGLELPRIANGSVVFKMQQLINNIDNVNDWDGPYLSYEGHATETHKLIYPKYEVIQAVARSVNDEWGGVNGVDAVLPSVCSGAAEPCGRWVNVGSIPEALAQEIDKYVDGEIDYKKGKVRVYKSSTSSIIIYLLDGLSNPTS